jgi:hypothetical protein
VLFSGSSPDLLGDILEVSSGIQGMRNRLQNGYMHSNRRLFLLLGLSLSLKGLIGENPSSFVCSEFKVLEGQS